MSRKRKKRPSAPPQSDPEQRRKQKTTDEEKAKAKIGARRKRKAKRQAAADQSAAALQVKQLERELRETERLASVERFLRDIQIARFAELITCWRKHVGLIDYIKRSGKNKHRLNIYERLVRGVETEWQRRSKLIHTREEYFDWPSTKADLGSGTIGEVGWAEQGVLGYLGYHVGEQSDLTSSQRSAILRRVFEMHLPPIESPAYMGEWGEPKTTSRLKKMANSIASFTRQAKRQSTRDMGEAIRSWECDLQMLHDEFYVGRFGFGWPTTEP